MYIHIIYIHIIVYTYDFQLNLSKSDSCFTVNLKEKHNWALINNIISKQSKQLRL